MDRLKLLAIGVVIGGLAIWTRPAMAATPTTRLVGPTGIIRSGDTIAVEVRIDSAGRLVNTIDLHVAYSPTYLQIIRVERQDRIWTLWPNSPSWDNHTGQLELSAGRPHGLVAIDASVATVLFRVMAAGLTSVIISQPASAVYLNDGLGTRVGATGAHLDVPIGDSLVPVIQLDPATTPVPDAWSANDRVKIVWPVESGTVYSYRWSNVVEDQPDDTPETNPGTFVQDQVDDGVYFFTIKSKLGDGLWSRVSQFRFLIDRQPPAAFEIFALPAYQTGGQATISWSTTDQTSGVAEYRVLINGHDRGSVTSPLVLDPEWSGTRLTIRALDGAGNERLAEFKVPGIRQSWAGAIAAGASLAIGISAWAIRRKSRRAV